MAGLYFDWLTDNIIEEILLFIRDQKSLLKCFDLFGMMKSGGLWIKKLGIDAPELDISLLPGRIRRILRYPSKRHTTILYTQILGAYKFAMDFKYGADSKMVTTELKEGYLRHFTNDPDYYLVFDRAFDPLLNPPTENTKYYLEFRAFIPNFVLSIIKTVDHSVCDYSGLIKSRSDIPTTFLVELVLEDPFLTLVWFKSAGY